MKNALSPEELMVREGYNLGYLLSWQGNSKLVGELTRICEQGIELSPKYEGIHTFVLSRGVTGYPSKYRPSNAEEAAELRDEFLCRLSMVPLDADIDVEMHILLDCPRFAQDYINHYISMQDGVV